MNTPGPNNQQLRYPMEALEDFLSITIHEYRARTSRPGIDLGKGNLGDFLGPPVGTIVLPIPELPNLTSQQKYGNISGAFNNVLATGLGEAYDAIADSVEGGGQIDVGGIAARVKEQAQNAGGPVLKELTAAVAGNIVGITGPMFQSMASGEISNPNIELLYNGPTLRSFSMSWSFAPKSSVEAAEVFEIFRLMKKSHLPQKNGGMLKVPHLFQIKVITNGKEARHYQKFFPAALEAISIKQDSAGAHITLPEGQPVISQMSCVWKELRVLTADDYQDVI